MLTKLLQQMGKFHNKHKPLFAKYARQCFIFFGGGEMMIKNLGQISWTRRQK